MIDYATMIKTLDPDALVLGPEEWGWSGYLFSGYDLQYGSEHGWSNLPDRAAHGSMDSMPWLLGELRQRSTAAGRRLLDVFTLHCYPQGGEFGNDVSSGMQLRRNRSTDASGIRHAWKTWISTAVTDPAHEGGGRQLSGTPIGITEYNWGEAHINSATAQADLLGIFSREGLDLATALDHAGRPRPPSRPIQMYRNYDGLRSTFGDTSVFASGPNPDQLAVFAAERSADGVLTLMAINKVLSGSTPATLTLTNFTGAGTAQVWQLNASNVIAHRPDAVFAGGTLSNTLPAQSITLFVLAPATPPPPRPNLHAGPARTDGRFELWLEGVAGRRYSIEASAGFTDGHDQHESPRQHLRLDPRRRRTPARSSTVLSGGLSPACWQRQRTGVRCTLTTSAGLLPLRRMAAELQFAARPSGPVVPPVVWVGSRSGRLTVWKNHSIRIVRYSWRHRTHAHIRTSSAATGCRRSARRPDPQPGRYA
jgi:hypothetical protein